MCIYRKERETRTRPSGSARDHCSRHSFSPSIHRNSIQPTYFSLFSQPGKKSRERRAHRALGAHPLVACNDWTSPDVWVPSAEARLAIARAARLPHRAARLPRRFRARSRTNAGSHRIGSASWANYSHSVSQLTLCDSDKIPSLRLD